MGERWAAVREFPDHYEISTSGRLRRINPYREHHGGRIRKPQTAQNGYVVYMLSVDNKVRLRSAHRMVADAFLGPIPEGMQVNHKNGDKGDPRLTNLEIVTNGANRAHAYRVLGVPPNRGGLGIKNVNAKLTWAQVKAIRARYAKGDSSPKIAAAYGVSRRTVWVIVTGRGRKTE